MIVKAYLFFIKPQWRLHFHKETGFLKIFEGEKEVVVDASGNFFSLPKDMACDFYNGWPRLQEFMNSDASDNEKDAYCRPVCEIIRSNRSTN